MKKALYFIIVSIILFINCDSDRNKWEKAKASKTIESYTEFMNNYPNNKFYQLALNAIDSINIKKVDSINTWQAYQEFVERYPDSKFIDYAKQKLAKEWWSVKILKTSSHNQVSFGNYNQKIQLSHEKSFVILRIALEIIALKGITGQVPERLAPYHTILDSELINYMSFKTNSIENPDTSMLRGFVSTEKPLWEVFFQRADVSKIRTQLLLGNNIKLFVDENDSLIPFYAQLEGHGTSVTEDGLYHFLDGGFNPKIDFAVYYIAKNILCAWIQPLKKVNLILYFIIPSNKNEFMFKFYDLPGIDLKIN